MIIFALIIIYACSISNVEMLYSGVLMHISSQLHIQWHHISSKNQQMPQLTGVAKLWKPNLLPNIAHLLT